MDPLVQIDNPTGSGEFIVVCEHASNAVPSRYQGLGLTLEALNSHAAWDPGALAVASALAARLDSPLVAPRVSRLLIDCNRPPEAEDAIVEQSEVYCIPGNLELSPEQRADRVRRYHRPFHDALARLIGMRAAAGWSPAILTIHSFVPIYNGVRREVEVGIVRDTDNRLSDSLIQWLRGTSQLEVAENAPYGPEDGVTHTLRTHAIPENRLNAMVEIRNDLIADADSQRHMAEALAACAAGALTELVARTKAQTRERIS